MGNKIPRKFNKIIMELTSNTNAGKVGDIMYVTKNEFNDYIGLNTRTKQSFNCPVGTLRIKEVFKIINIEI